MAEKAKNQASKATQATTEATETKKAKAVELESIDLALYPSIQGDRARRALRVGDGKTKFDVSAPIPKTDEQAKAWYNVDLATLVRKGLIQTMYDNDSDARVTCAAAVKAGKLPDAATIREDFEKSFFAERTRATGEGVKAEVKAVKAAKESTGLTMDQIIALAKRQLAQNAGAKTEEEIAAWITANTK